LFVSSITNEKTFINLRCKLRDFGFLVKYETLTFKYLKVVHTRFLTSDDLVGNLVQVLVEVEAVDGMACGVDGFCPK
jgi:hypothetical protein